MSELNGALPLRREQVAQAARLLAEALHDDPAYAFVFPPGSRPGAQQEFFRRHREARVAGVHPPPYPIATRRRRRRSSAAARISG